MAAAESSEAPRTILPMNSQRQQTIGLALIVLLILLFVLLRRAWGLA